MGDVLLPWLGQNRFQPLMTRFRFLSDVSWCMLILINGGLQEKFASMIVDAGFQKVEYENLVGGVVAIHSGLKFWRHVFIFPRRSRFTFYAGVWRELPGAMWAGTRSHVTVLMHKTQVQVRRCDWWFAFGDRLQFLHIGKADISSVRKANICFFLIFESWNHFIHMNKMGYWQA